MKGENVSKKKEVAVPMLREAGVPMEFIKTLATDRELSIAIEALSYTGLPRVCDDWWERFYLYFEQR